MVDFKIKGKQLIEKVVAKHGNGGIVYCPRKWIGKKVIVILEGE